MVRRLNCRERREERRTKWHMRCAWLFCCCRSLIWSLVLCFFVFVLIWNRPIPVSIFCLLLSFYSAVVGSWAYNALLTLGRWTCPSIFLHFVDRVGIAFFLPISLPSHPIPSNCFNAFNIVCLRCLVRHKLQWRAFPLELPFHYSHV